jgi:hypothetical protein
MPLCLMQRSHRVKHRHRPQQVLPVHLHLQCLSKQTARLAQMTPGLPVAHMQMRPTMSRQPGHWTQAGSVTCSHVLTCCTCAWSPGEHLEGVAAGATALAPSHSRQTVPTTHVRALSALRTSVCSRPAARPRPRLSTRTHAVSMHTCTG